MSKEIINYSILSGLAVGLVSLVILFFKKPRPCPKGEGDSENDEHSACYNRTIILNSIVVALLTGMCVYCVNKMLSGSSVDVMDGGELDKIMTGSAPF